MTLPQNMVDLIDERVRAALAERDRAKQPTRARTAAGTVVERTGLTTALVTFEGGGVAAPVKVYGDVNIEPGDRVGMKQIGDDWVIDGTFTRRRKIVSPDGATTGQIRWEIGTDAPPELQADDVHSTLLAYITDPTSGIEIGYFYIAVSQNIFSGTEYPTFAVGQVLYPTPGVPSSATINDIKEAYEVFMPSGTLTMIKAAALVQSERVASGDHGFSTIVEGDSTARWVCTAGGKQEWGSGAAARDVTVARTGTGELTVTGDLKVTGIGGLLYARKTSAETVNNSAALQNDDELALSLPANSTLECELRIKQSSGATPGFKADFTLPSGATWVDAFFIAGATGTLQFGPMPNASITGISGTGSDATLLIKFTVTTTNAGTLQLRWAQNTANASNTTVQAGGILTARVVE